MLVSACTALCDFLAFVKMFEEGKIASLRRGEITEADLVHWYVRKAGEYAMPIFEWLQDDFQRYTLRLHPFCEKYRRRQPGHNLRSWYRPLTCESKDAFIGLTIILGEVGLFCDKDNVLKVLEEYREEFRACYKVNSRAVGPFPPAFDVAWQTLRTGRTRVWKQAFPSPSISPVQLCVEALIEHMPFPLPQGSVRCNARGFRFVYCGCQPCPPHLESAFSRLSSRLCYRCTRQEDGEINCSRRQENNE